MEAPETPQDYADKVGTHIIEQAEYNIGQGHKVSIHVRGIPEAIRVDEVSADVYTAILSLEDGPTYHVAITEVFAVKVELADNLRR